MQTLSVPGKTFLLGEYSVLEGGPALLISTEPRFELKVRAREKNQNAKMPFHPDSPAGRYVELHRDFFAAYDLEFVDPHIGSGGLGASSAEFATTYALHRGVESASGDWSSVLHEYRTNAHKKGSRPPSGADVISQYLGSVTYVDMGAARARTLDWKFQDLGFSLFRTGKKLATHEHLSQSIEFSIDSLRNAVRAAVSAFETINATQLIGAVHDFARALESHSLVAPHTLELLHELKNESFVLAAKGCGAMGADVVLVLHAKSQRPQFEKWAHGRGLAVCGSDLSLSRGYRIDSDGAV